MACTVNRNKLKRYSISLLISGIVFGSAFLLFSILYISQGDYASAILCAVPASVFFSQLGLSLCCFTILRLTIESDILETEKIEANEDEESVNDSRTSEPENV